MNCSVRNFVCFLLALPPAIFAQGPVASVSGEIHDPSGAAVAVVAVTARNVDTNVTRATVTNGSGVYTIGGLTPGNYELVAEVSGFKRAVRSDLTLQVAQAARIDFNLELGATSDVVNVEAQAPVTETESAATGTVIDNQKVVELPLNGRQFYGLALLVPGVNLSAENSTTGYRGGFNVSGRAETNNNFTVNGLDNNDQSVNAPSVRPSVDDIQEFKLLTGIFPAEYGRSSGGQVIVVTKSGTNSIHGTAFEFIRNQVLDAANYYTPAGQQPAFRRNDFGATIGGPIRKDMTFFHFSYEGVRLAQQIAALGTVPTIDEINGNFSTLLTGSKPTIIKNPFTGVAFPGNMIPANMINPIGQALLKQYPAATTPTLSGPPQNNYTLNGTQTENSNQYSVRIDHTFSSKDNLNASYQYFTDPIFFVNNVLCGSSVLPNGGCFTGWTGQLFGISENHIFTPTLVNEVRLGVQRMRQPRCQTDANISFWAAFGITNVGANVPCNTGVPNTTITGYTKLGGPTNLPQNRWDTTYDYRDSISWQHGTHSFKFGAEFRPFDTNFTFVSNGRGALNFNASSAAPTSGYALADVLLGYPTTATNNPLAPPIYGRTKAFFAYAQDDWKLTPNLTINYGLRWEYNTPYTDAQNRLSTFRAGQIAVQNAPGVGSTLYARDYKKFAPRLGLAWQPFGNSKTVIRAGGGVFFDNVITFNGLPIVTINPPYRAPATYTSSVANPITLNNPFPLGSPSGQPAVAGISPDYTTPDIYEWSFSIQRELPSNTLLEVSYLGSKGSHLPLEINANQPLPGPGTAAQVQARRPFPAFANVTYLESSNNSEYESLQAKVEKRYSKGIALLVSETYGKSLDEGPQAGSTSNSSKILPQNSYNVLSTERGLSDYNVKTRTVASVIGELPFGSGKPWLRDGFMAALVGGWQLSGIFTAESGRPFTPYYAANISNTSELSDRPNYVAGCDPYAGAQTVAHWINTACFVAPAAGTFGNLGRNTLIGPKLVNLDFAVDRNFQVMERLRIQFRAEAFNILNHPNFNLPATGADSPNFGSLTSAMDPRQLQFGLKFVF